MHILPLSVTVNFFIGSTLLAISSSPITTITIHLLVCYYNRTSWSPFSGAVPLDTVSESWMALSSLSQLAEGSTSSHFLNIALQQETALW